MGFSAEIARTVRDHLHPTPYTDVEDLAGTSLELLLSHRMGPFARYALALSSWKEGVDGAIQLEEARASVTRALGAMWALRGVGAYLIFVGDEACWRPQMDSMRPDMTGLHHTIIQGVHFLDPASGARSFHQAAWGPVRFGGIQSVAALVELLTFPLAEDAFDDPPPREG